MPGHYDADFTLQSCSRDYFTAVRNELSKHAIMFKWRNLLGMEALLESLYYLEYIWRLHFLELTLVFFGHDVSTYPFSISIHFSVIAIVLRRGLVALQAAVNTRADTGTVFASDIYKY